MNFTTRDQDNDQWSNYNCALPNYNGISGGWWYNECAAMRPTTQYNHKSAIVLNGQWHALPFIEMKIRPKNCI